MTTKGTNNFVDKKIHGIKTSLMNLVSRFVLEKTDTSKKMQEVKGELFSDEVKEELEHFQNYGFTSRPPKGSEGVALSVNGNRDHVIVINIDNREFRLKTLADGEVALYNNNGASIILKANGSIELNCTEFKVNASSKVDMTTPMVNASQEMTVKENIFITAEGTDISDIRSKYNSHTHAENADTITDPPIPQF